MWERKTGCVCVMPSVEFICDLVVGLPRGISLVVPWRSSGTFFQPQSGRTGEAFSVRLVAALSMSGFSDLFFYI